MVVDFQLDADAPSGNTGTITGTVTDDTGQVLGDVLVETDTNQSAVTKSKGKGAGEFTLEGVWAGDRTVTASLNGDVTQSKTVTLAVGQTWVVDFQLVLISTSSFRKVDIDTQGPGHISLASFSSPGSISRLRNVNWIVK